MKPIDGSSVIVTGGGSGIGAGTALYFASRGARVTICGRRTAKIEAVAAEIGSFCQAVTADVTVAADRERLLAAALDFGGGKLDVLISNAASTYRGEIDALDEQKLLEAFHTNVIAGMMLTGLCVPHLEKTHGAVVFIGSMHTQRAFPGTSPYAATKGAVETLTRVLAAELGRKKVRVNCVRPGAVFTEMRHRAGHTGEAQALERLHSLAPEHALGRIGTAEEIAEAIAHLACAEWTTGSIVSVDGGLSLGVTHAGRRHERSVVRSRSGRTPCATRRRDDREPAALGRFLASLPRNDTRAPRDPRRGWRALARSRGSRSRHRNARRRRLSPRHGECVSLDDG